MSIIKYPCFFDFLKWSLASFQCNISSAQMNSPTSTSPCTKWSSSHPSLMGAKWNASIWTFLQSTPTGEFILLNKKNKPNLLCQYYKRNIPIDLMNATFIFCRLYLQFLYCFGKRSSCLVTNQSNYKSAYNLIPFNPLIISIAISKIIGYQGHNIVVCSLLYSIFIFFLEHILVDLVCLQKLMDFCIVVSTGPSKP